MPTDVTTPKKPATRGEALLQGARDHNAAFQNSEFTYKEQLKRLKRFINREILVTILSGHHSSITLAMRAVGSDKEEWDTTVRCPEPAAGTSFSCIVKHAGISGGRSYLILFVTMGLSIGDSSLQENCLRTGYEYRLWLKDIAEIEILGEG